MDNLRGFSWRRWTTLLILQLCFYTRYRQKSLPDRLVLLFNSLPPSSEVNVCSKWADLLWKSKSVTYNLWNCKVLLNWSLKPPLKRKQDWSEFNSQDLPSFGESAPISWPRWHFTSLKMQKLTSTCKYDSLCISSLSWKLPNKRFCSKLLFCVASALDWRKKIFWRWILAWKLAP